MSRRADESRRLAWPPASRVGYDCASQACRSGSGSNGLPPLYQPGAVHCSKCRWQPLARPVSPTKPIGWPVLTLSPFVDERRLAQVHVDEVGAGARAVDDEVVARARVVLLELHGAAARRHDRRAAGGEDVLALVAAAAAEAAPRTRRSRARRAPGSGSARNVNAPGASRIRPAPGRLLARTSRARRTAVGRRDAELVHAVALDLARRRAVPAHGLGHAGLRPRRATTARSRRRRCRGSARPDARRPRSADDVGELRRALRAEEHLVALHLGVDRAGGQGRGGGSTVSGRAVAGERVPSASATAIRPGQRRARHAGDEERRRRARAARPTRRRRRRRPRRGR